MFESWEELGLKPNKRYYRLNLRQDKTDKIFLIQKTKKDVINIYHFMDGKYKKYSFIPNQEEDDNLYEMYEHSLENSTIKKLLAEYNYT